MAKKKKVTKKAISKAVKKQPSKSTAKPKSDKVKKLIDTNPPVETPAPTPEPEKIVPPVDEYQTLHDFLTSPELIGAWLGSDTNEKGVVTRHKFQKADGTKVSTIGSVPLPVDKLSGYEIISIQYTGKDVNGNFNFVICELETEDKGFFDPAQTKLEL